MWVILTPIILLLLVGVLVYAPPIQNWLVNLIAAKVTEETGLNVHVDEVGLSFPLDLDMRGVLATDESGDTVLDVRQAIVDLDLTRLLSWQIEVEEVSLHQGFVDTKNIIEGLKIRGRLGLFKLASPILVDLKQQTASINNISLNNCDLNLFIGESPEDNDTTSTVLPPLVFQLGSLDIGHVHVLCNIKDSTHIESNIAGLAASDFHLRLDDLSMSLNRLTAKTDYLILDSLALPAIAAQADEVAYDSLHLALGEASVRMSETELRANGNVEWGSINTSQPNGVFDLCASFTMGNHDLDSLCRHYRLDVMRYDRTASVEASVHAIGNMGEVTVKGAYVRIGSLLSLDANALAKHPLDSLLDASLKAEARTLFGNATLDAHYNNPRQAYSGVLDLVDVRPHAIAPAIPIRSLTAHAEVDGNGFDSEAPATRISASLDIPQCQLDSLQLGGAKLTAEVENTRANVRLNYANRLAEAAAQLNVIRTKNIYEGTFAIDLMRADLHALGVTDSVLSVAACLHMDLSTDLDYTHRLTGALNDVLLIRPDTVLRPVDLKVDLMARPDSLHAFASAGGMCVVANTSDGYEELSRQVDVFMKELDNQRKTHFLDQNALRPLLPRADVMLNISGRNPVSTWLGMMGYTFNDVLFRLNSNPDIGLNGGGHLMCLNTGSMQLDTIRWSISQDTVGVKFNAQVKNSPKNRQFVFDSRLDLSLLGDGASVNARYIDGKGVTGVDIGAVAKLTRHGVKVSLSPLNPIVAYRDFRVNDSNYVFLARNGDILANVDILADDGTGVQLYSARALDEFLACDSCPKLPASHDLTASFRHFNLGELSRVMPYLPSLGGILEGDAHYMRQDSVMSAALDTRIQNFAYSGAPIGNIGANVAYLPGDRGQHFVDGILSVEGRECASFNGTYAAEGDGRINVEASLNSFPLSIVNGFVDKKLAQASGALDGVINVSGTPSQPIVNGNLATKDIQVLSTDYSLLLKVEDHTVNLVNNYLDLNEMRIFSTGKEPVVMDGWLDFRDLSDMRLALSLKGKNFELINAKKTKAATAYGKVYCDIDASLGGSMRMMRLDGSLKVLGNTDVTYILRDSPLTVEDRLADLVTFVDFSNDEAPVEEEELATMDIIMNMKVLVDEAARVHCLLSEDRSSYVDIEGGGELVMAYSPQGDLQINGRYTVNSGEMKYQLPIIPLKTFKIENGSYIAFNGRILNPTLNITAKERVKAVVGSEGKANRSVAFDVGVKITQTLENMGLQFTIESPEDLTIQSELATMDETARGRTAVTMLATGMYLSDNNTSGFTATNALNSFLQSEISNITGKALGSIDLTFGMENSTSASGASQTDYSFRFAKHFWGNRISVVLGGKVSSGSEAENTGETIIDNVSVEYRLDKSATRYVRVFYDKAYESLIDGKITEMGAGLVLRRKTTRLGDLFIFKSSKK